MRISATAVLTYVVMATRSRRWLRLINSAHRR